MAADPLFSVIVPLEYHRGQWDRCWRAWRAQSLPPSLYETILVGTNNMLTTALLSAVRFVKDFVAAGKPVAAICHGPQVLISANTLRGRTLTCWPSIAIDVKNAGGLYVDKPVVEDGNLITSRKPDDVPMFSDAIIKALTR